MCLWLAEFGRHLLAPATARRCIGEMFLRHPRGRHGRDNGKSIRVHHSDSRLWHRWLKVRVDRPLAEIQRSESLDSRHPDRLIRMTEKRLLLDHSILA